MPILFAVRNCQEGTYGQSIATAEKHDGKQLHTIRCPHKRSCHRTLFKKHFRIIGDKILGYKTETFPIGHLGQSATIFEPLVPRQKSDFLSSAKMQTAQNWRHVESRAQNIVGDYLDGRSKLLSTAGVKCAGFTNVINKARHRSIYRYIQRRTMSMK